MVLFLSVSLYQGAVFNCMHVQGCRFVPSAVFNVSLYQGAVLLRKPVTALVLDVSTVCLMFQLFVCRRKQHLLADSSTFRGGLSGHGRPVMGLLLVAFSRLSSRSACITDLNYVVVIELLGRWFLYLDSHELWTQNVCSLTLTGLF